MVLLLTDFDDGHHPVTRDMSFPRLRLPGVSATARGGAEKRDAEAVASVARQTKQKIGD